MKMNKANTSCTLSLCGLFPLLTALPLGAAGPQPPIRAYTVTDVGDRVSMSSETAFPGFVPSRVSPAEYCGPGKQMTEMVARFRRDYGTHLADLQIIGNADVGQHQEHAFIFRKSHLTDLGVLPGGSYSDSEGINHRGEVVGYSYIHPYGPAWHAFLYSGNKMIDLNTCIGAKSGWVLEAGYSINDAVQIVGAGTHKGKERTFLLTPR